MKKVFVFNDVLKDYTGGMVVVVAENEDEAIELCRKEFDSYSVAYWQDADCHEVNLEESYIAGFSYGGG